MVSISKRRLPTLPPSEATSGAEDEKDVAETAALTDLRAEAEKLSNLRREIRRLPPPLEEGIAVRGPRTCASEKKAVPDDPATSQKSVGEISAISDRLRVENGTLQILTQTLEKKVHELESQTEREHERRLAAERQCEEMRSQLDVYSGSLGLLDNEATAKDTRLQTLLQTVVKPMWEERAQLQDQLAAQTLDFETFVQEVRQQQHVVQTCLMRGNANLDGHQRDVAALGVEFEQVAVRDAELRGANDLWERRCRALESRYEALSEARDELLEQCRLLQARDEVHARFEAACVSQQSEIQAFLASQKEPSPPVRRSIPRGLRPPNVEQEMALARSGRVVFKVHEKSGRKAPRSLFLIDMMLKWSKTSSVARNQGSHVDLGDIIRTSVGTESPLECVFAIVVAVVPFVLFVRLCRA